MNIIDNKDLVLSLNEKDEKVMADLTKEIFREEINELPPLKEGYIAINGIYVFECNEGVEVSVYVRNGGEHPLSLKDIPLVITDNKEQIVGRQIFDMSDLGIIPPKSVRPYKIIFKKENLDIKKVADGWKVNFETMLNKTKKVKLTLQQLPENISYELENQIMEYYKKKEFIELGQISIEGFRLERLSNGECSFLVIIRNGNDKKIQIDEIPVKIINADGKKVFGGAFKFEGMIIDAFSANIFRVEIPESKIPVDEVNLNECIVKF